MDREFVANLVIEIGNARTRVAAQTAVIGRSAGPDLLQEEAVLRNLAMQLAALEQMLGKINEQAYGG